MGIPIKMDDLGVPLFLETPTWVPRKTNENSWKPKKNGRHFGQ